MNLKTEAPVPVITVDGPSGSGKGTISFRLAERMGFHLLDSGALYRLVAYIAMERGVAVHAEADLAQLAAALDVEFERGDFHFPVRPILCGEDVSERIRSPECGLAASQIAALPEVRAALLARQHAFRRPPGLVADGRDMGTVVFGDAVVKIFLTASAEERARRRHKQLIAKGMGVNLASLLEDIRERDRRDIERSVSPLRPAADAAIIDTDGREINVVFALVADVISANLGHKLN